MIHQRRVFREAICTLLASAGTAAGARVFDHPYDPRTAFPCLVVEDLAERQGSTSMPAGPGRPIERRYQFSVSAEVQQIANYARARDDLLAEVEAAIGSAAIVGIKAITPAGYDVAESNDGQRPIRVGIQRFEALYYTAQGDPSTPL